MNCYGQVKGKKRPTPDYNTHGYLCPCLTCQHMRSKAGLVSEKEESSVKVCSKCHRTLSKTAFYKNLSTADGLQPACRACEDREYTERKERKHG